MEHSESVRALAAEYWAFEKTLASCEASDETAHLTIFNGNKSKPIHRWFLFKEGFSDELLTWVASHFALNLRNCQQILDPFCGVGTSLLAAQLALPNGALTNLWGVERNPFISFVAQTKLNWHVYRIDQLQSFITMLVRPLGDNDRGLLEKPELTTIKNPSVFSDSTLSDLLGYRARIERQCDGMPERDFFLLGWSSIIERVSGVRRDGRALRFVGKNEDASVSKELEEQWKNMVQDLQTVRSTYEASESGLRPANAKVISGDGRSIEVEDIKDGSVDLIVYSPPYLNNIDYSEVYKLELWLMGLVNSREEFLQLRRNTFRSHPSVSFPKTTTLDSLAKDGWAVRLREALLEAIPNDKDHAWRERLFRAYIDDTLASLKRQCDLSRPGSLVICVVGNSMHGRTGHPIIVATDLIVTALAQLAGFDVERLQVARQLRRRDHDNKFLRESILVFRKPK